MIRHETRSFTLGTYAPFTVRCRPPVPSSSPFGGQPDFVNPDSGDELTSLILPFSRRWRWCEAYLRSFHISWGRKLGTADFDGNGIKTT